MWGVVSVEKCFSETMRLLPIGSLLRELPTADRADPIVTGRGLSLLFRDAISLGGQG